MATHLSKPMFDLVLETDEIYKLNHGLLGSSLKGRQVDWPTFKRIENWQKARAVERHARKNRLNNTVL